LADQEIIAIVRRFLAALPAAGIHPAGAILFGSFARGESHAWSDIDVLVIAPEFDEFRPIPMNLATRLWSTARKIDLRLEAVPCGVAEWNAPRTRPILKIAAREGLQVAA